MIQFWQCLKHQHWRGVKYSFFFNYAKGHITLERGPIHNFGILRDNRVGFWRIQRRLVFCVRVSHNTFVRSNRCKFLALFRLSLLPRTPFQRYIRTNPDHILNILAVSVLDLCPNRTIHWWNSCDVDFFFPPFQPVFSVYVCGHKGEKNH